MAHIDNYIERDGSGSSAGVWAVVAMLVVLLALLLFGSRLFSRGENGGNNNIDIRGSVPAPSGSGTQ